MADAKRKAQAGNEWEGMNFREGRDFEGPNIIQCTFDIDYDSEMNILQDYKQCMTCIKIDLRCVMSYISLSENGDKT